MLDRLSLGLQPIVHNLNLPTVIKTTIFPGDQEETLMIATQVGEIFYIRNNTIGTFLDIRQNILQLGTNGGYDERGLLGLAFHPNFRYNGLFYLHYSLADSEGPGALPGGFSPNPCDENTLNLRWTDRENRYDHIDTVEEWMLHNEGQPIKRRTLLNIRRPFANHNGVNSLNFSPETGRLVLTIGDGGLGYDPFNLAQTDNEIAGKIIEIDVDMDLFIDNMPVVTRFSELSLQVLESLTVIAKGVRNIPGISYQFFNDRYIKYVGNVGQDLVESIFAFIYYRPVPATDIVKSYIMNSSSNQEGFINLGWRGWEGDLPTSLIRPCDSNLNQKIIAYYNEAITISTKRIYPLCCYYHQDPRVDKFQGRALTGVQAYMGNEIPSLMGSCVFTDFARRTNTVSPPRGVLAYTWFTPECQMNEYYMIDIDYDFGNEAAFFTCLGSNINQTKLYLGVYGSANVTDLNRGSVYEIVKL